jgi:hypothetical protein
MAYDLEIDGDVRIDLATIQGWRGFREWASRSEKMTDFLRDNRTEDTTALTDALEELIEVDPPNDDVLGIASALIEGCQMGSVVEVTDGLGPDDGEDGEWWVNGKLVSNTELEEIDGDTE